MVKKVVGPVLGLTNWAYVPQAINIFGDKRNKEAAEKLAKERELQKIHVKKEDIELIVSLLCSILLLIVPLQRIVFVSR